MNNIRRRLGAWIVRSGMVNYELGRQAGYDDGYQDGRRVARPVILPYSEESSPVSRSS